MVTVSSCAPEVYSSPSTVSLVDQFCSCPAAAKLLASDQLIKPLFIESRDIPGAKTSSDYDNYWNLKKITILIPLSHLHKEEALTDLAFEVFNAQRSDSDLLKQAERGNMGMDDFARKLEELEMAETHGHYALREQCAKAWKIPAEPNELKDLDLEVTRFAQETECHTDAIRSRWIDKFQKNYCSKHPEDSRSCKMKKKDLCDSKKVQLMPEAESMDFIFARVCKMFPDAHENVKNHPVYRRIVEQACPEALGINDDHSTLLAAAVSFAASLAAAISITRYIYRRI